jgi:L-threonylcarbamoyladenylate synthase
MDKIFFMSRIVLANENSIKEAADLIRAGEVVVLPTETVYGLGANALNDDAVAKIFKAKNRPAHNPLIVHVLDIEKAAKLVDVDERAKKIASIFWPGPLTLILPAKKENGVSQLVSAGLETLAVRSPSHKIMRDIMAQADVPIAAPSANASGEPSATTPKHAAESLGDTVEFILGTGPCDVGLESTVLDLSGEEPVILRAGAITAEDLKPYLGDIKIEDGASEKPKSPGLLLKHYAPSLPLRLKAVDVKKGEALLAFGSTKFMGVEGGGYAKDLPDHAFCNLSEDGDLEEAAKNLFMMLRDLDVANNKAIAVMDIPNQGIGVAINDRLRRAAQGR